MTYLSVDKDGTEYIYDQVSPYREDGEDFWRANYDKHGESYPCIELPKGSIAKLIGRELTWEDEPVELKDAIKRSMDCKWCIDGICMKRTMCIMGQMDCPDFTLKQ